MMRDDYVERMIKELASALARALGLARSGERTGAIREIDACYRSLGVNRTMMSRLDAKTMLSVLGPAKSAALADVLEAEAVVLTGEGPESEAHSRQMQASSLRQLL